MTDQIGAAEVLVVIEQELLRAQAGVLEARHELLVAIRSARSDHANDVMGEAGATLATLLAYGATSTQQSLNNTLLELKDCVAGLGEVYDVIYVESDGLASEEMSLREQLPSDLKHRLTAQEMVEAEAFVAAAFKDGGPEPNEGPRRRRPGP